MSDVRQGEVYWLDFGPARGSTPAERRPCVVVQNDIFNQTAINTTVVCLITSNPRRARDPGNVVLAKGEAGLPKECVVNVSQLLTIDKSELNEPVGRLPVRTVDAIRAGLHLLFDRE